VFSELGSRRKKPPWRKQEGLRGSLGREAPVVRARGFSRRAASGAGGQRGGPEVQRTETLFGFGGATLTVEPDIFSSSAKKRPSPSVLP
jgi:hypothetical protein